MPRYPIINALKLVKILKISGFELIHTKGSHHIFRNPVSKKMVSVPVHKGKDLGRGITKAILQDAEIPIEILQRKKIKK